MTQETTNQIIVGVSGILTAVLPPIVAAIIKKRRRPSSPPPSPWAWFSVVALLCGVTSLIFSVRAPSYPADTVRYDTKLQIQTDLDDGSRLTAGNPLQLLPQQAKPKDQRDAQKWTIKRAD